MLRIDWTKRGSRGAAGWVLAGVGVLLALPAGADDAKFAVPRTVIYPGDVIAVSMLDARQLVRGASGQGLATVELAIGKVSRRTLLPGQVIPLNALRLPDVVRSGKLISLVYASGDLVITGQGLAMQSGAAGDTVAVQNTDSNAIVRGKVQQNGSVRIED